MLTMADANGNAGGVDPVIRTVTPGSSSTCQMPTPDPSFAMTANVTGTLQTCQPWGLSIQGGTPPYGVTVARLNTPVVTNMTVPSGDDIVTYINRAEPLGVILAAVHDSTGRWGIGTSLVNTAGSSDTTCSGLVTSYTSAVPSHASSASIQASQSPSSTSTPTSAKSSSLKTPIIVGICV
ncbi:hypothetical protein JAAARDRAFT_186448, partial [Jaapia argillacea MUCL 33604]